MSKRRKDRRVTVLVASSVYGYEDLLEQVFAVLSAYGFKVLMSHKGTIPLDSNRTALQNCLEAVRNCDVFLGIITSRYGSGRVKNALSITHREILKAIKLAKPRFFLVHRNVVIARQLLRQFRYYKNGKPRPYTFFKGTPVLDDIRILDMYDAAIRSDLAMAKRKGNWVQQYETENDVLRFLETQFGDPEKSPTILYKGK